MIRLIVLAIVAYFAFRQFGWVGAAAVAVAYIILMAVMGAVSAGGKRQQANQLLARKLSEDEKDHLTSAHEHQEKMLDHKAQFDPELRKSRGQQ